MWEKLLGLFKDQDIEQEEYVPASIAKREARKQQLDRRQQLDRIQQLDNQPVATPEATPAQPGQGTLIGFNYLKGLEDENDMLTKRRFSSLSKLLRGDYKDGKIEAINAEPERNLRRKDSE